MIEQQEQQQQQQQQQQKQSDKKKTYDNSSWWNISRPKYTKPTRLHELGVNRIGRLLESQNYVVTKEYRIDLRDGGEGYRGIKDMKPPVDIHAKNEILDDELLIQIDGEYHRKGRNIGKTKNRNEAQASYAQNMGMRFVTMTTEEANHMTDSQLYDKLNIGWLEMGGGGGGNQR